MSLHDKAFLQLVRLGIGNADSVDTKGIADWSAIKAIAEEHGLSAVVLDALNTIDVSLTGSLQTKIKLEWIGEVLQSYEARYQAYKNTIGEMAAFYNSHGFKMMVLKGYACSLDWPNPSHRPCGDIDIWQFGDWHNADDAVEREKGIRIDTSHHHHTVFYWGVFMVENHYDFINVHHHKSNAAFEAILKEEGKDDTHFVDVRGEIVYLPSPNLHALFLLKHACAEFAASGLNLRQLLDWAFFVKAHGTKVNWEWVLRILDEFGMKTMFNIINAICVEDLGFQSDIFPNLQYDAQLKDKVLNEILSPATPNEQPRRVFARILWKYRRWKANEWKHNLCYKESMWSSFWSGVWNHILKPSSI